MSSLIYRLREADAKLTDTFHPYWVKGKFLSNNQPSFELNFEDVGRAYLPGTFLSYLGIWNGKQCLFEFSAGKLCRKPSVEDFDRYIGPLIRALAGYEHVQGVMFANIIDRSTGRRFDAF